jgi:hypothetical protein
MNLIIYNAEGNQEVSFKTFYLRVDLFPILSHQEQYFPIVC